jgi:hypothetical protein
MELPHMNDMMIVALVMAGVALAIAASWQLASRQPFDAIHFVARVVASFVASVVMAVLLYGLVFVIGLSNIAGSQSNLFGFLTVCFWLSIGIAFVLAISPGEDRKTFLLRFIARWIWAWARVVGAGILLALGFCAVLSSV